MSDIDRLFAQLRAENRKAFMPFITLATRMSNFRGW